MLTEAERDAREGWAPQPDLLTVTEAAAMLGASRQRVLQRIKAGSLRATKRGRDYVIEREAIRDR